MKEIKFGTPMGEIINNPDFEKIERLIMNRGIEFWESGSGQSIIEYSDDNLTSTLYICIAEDYGFYLEFCKNNKYYIILKDEDFKDTTEVYIEGEPILVPRSMFIDKKETVEQVRSIFYSGDVDYTTCNWVEKEKVNWEYGEEFNGQESEEVKYSSFKEFVINNSKIKRKWMTK